MMRTHCFILFLAIVPAVSSAEELIPLEVFQRETAPEHVYSADQEEITRLKKTDGWKSLGILGHASSVEGEGLVKLNRAHRGRWHVFYTKAPEELPKGTELEKFDVWVWEKEAEGLVPIYGCSLPDWRDMIYSTDIDEIKKAIDKTWDSQRVRRKNHGVVFYLKPAKSRDDQSADQ